MWVWCRVVGKVEIKERYDGIAKKTSIVQGILACLLCGLFPFFYTFVVGFFPQTFVFFVCLFVCFFNQDILWGF